jgi:RNA recognition motif-containing protein
MCFPKASSWSHGVAIVVNPPCRPILQRNVCLSRDSYQRTSQPLCPSHLYVLQIPKAMGEEDLFPTFDSFGPLKDIAVIRDKHTGLHRGCAFITYWSGADADRAQEALHDKYTFPGARRPAQVKPAEPSGMPTQDAKLLSSLLSLTNTFSSCFSTGK